MPAAVFEEILSLLLNTVAGKTREEVQDLVRVLDSTTIGLFAKTHRAPRFPSNNSAIKPHLLHDPDSICPVWFQVTPARLHLSRVREEHPLRPGETYVFDGAYNNATLWNRVNETGAVFVTRAKSNLVFDVVENRLHPDNPIVADETVRLAGGSGKEYTAPPRRIEAMDETNGRVVVFVTNDFARGPEEITGLYRRRWEIETFFKWLKQNYKIRRFLAKNPKAIRLQIITALIAYVLSKLPHLGQRIDVPLKRVASLARNNLYNQSEIHALLKPPDPSPLPKPTNQFALDSPGQ